MWAPVTGGGARPAAPRLPRCLARGVCGPEPRGALRPLTGGRLRARSIPPPPRQQLLTFAPLPLPWRAELSRQFDPAPQVSSTCRRTLRLTRYLSRPAPSRSTPTRYAAWSPTPAPTTPAGGRTRACPGPRSRQGSATILAHMVATLVLARRPATGSAVPTLRSRRGAALMVTVQCGSCVAGV